MNKNTKNEIFCPLPWVSMCVQPYGPALCCSSYEDLRLHDNETPFEVYNNINYQDIRKKFLNDEWPDQCRICQKNEDAGVTSYRQEIIQSEEFSDVLENKNNLQLNSSSIKVLELASSNVCNLKCRMCGPRFSSKWNEDIEKAHKHGVAWQIYTVDSNDKPVKDLDLDNLLNLLGNEPVLTLKGGEPLINKQNEELFRHLIIRKMIRNIELRVITNGTILPKWFLISLPFFKKVIITFSIDGSGSLNRYIRNGKFSNADLKKNLDKILQLRPDTIIVVSTAFQIYNMLSYTEIVREFLPWTQAFTATPALNFQLNSQIVPDNLKNTSAERILSLLLEINSDYTRSTLTSILEFMYQGTYNPEAWKHFKEFTLAFDNIRSEKLQDVEPELYSLLSL